MFIISNENSDKYLNI